MKFSIGPSVFSQTPAYDIDADMESRLATLEANVALTGVQHAEAASPGPVTVPSSTAWAVLSSLPVDALVVPDAARLLRVYHEFDLVSSTSLNVQFGLSIVPAFLPTYTLQTVYYPADISVRAAVPAVVFAPGALASTSIVVWVHRIADDPGSVTTISNIYLSGDVF